MSLPTIVFVHGAGGGAWEWEFWQAVFEERGWQTLSGDLMPNSRGVEFTQVDDYVEQIIDWIHQVQGDVPPIVVGASMAGPLLLKAIETQPVSAAVLVNSVPVEGVDGWPQAKVDFPDVIPWAAKGLAERSLEKMVDYEASIAALVDQSWRDESGSVLNALYLGIAVKQPTCPLLVITGSEDQDIPSELGANLAHYLAADLMTFRNVSHLGVLLGHRAELVANVVCEWVESLEVSLSVSLGDISE